MSTVVHPKGHRHTRSAAMPLNTASPHHPQNPHYLNLQAQEQNSQPAMDYSAQPTTPPRTPRRDYGQPLPQNKTSSNATEPGSKQKPRNKKPKNVVTSPPAVARNGQNTPAIAGQAGGAPSSAKPISTPSTAAFAGPTFHASPAPSALPIPSFYSKSVPESPGMKSLKPLKDPSSPDSTSPPAAVSNLQFHREESPLDIFFRADREEKARARSASSSQTTTESGPFKPPSESPRASQTPPASSAQSRLRHASKLSSSGMFTMELDGSPSPGAPYGPAFSTPYSERINAARSPNAPASSSDPSIKRGQATSSSEALKAYLFSGSQKPSPVPSASNPFGGNSLSSSFTYTTPAELRNPSHPLGGSRGSPASSSSQANNYPGLQDLNMSLAHASNTSGRPSGLRQEVTPAKTPTKTTNRNANYPTSSTPSRIYGHPSNANDFTSTFSRGSAPPLPASPFGTSAGNNPGDLKDMEDNLRKMLKLDSAGSSGASGQSIERVPAAAVSVPSYVGGRAPPMNGMHNGVMGS